MNVLLKKKHIFFYHSFIETISGVDDELGEMFLNEQTPNEQQIHVCKNNL